MSLYSDLKDKAKRKPLYKISPEFLAYLEERVEYSLTYRSDARITLTQVNLREYGLTDADIIGYQDLIEKYFGVAISVEAYYGGVTLTFNV